MPRPDPNPFRTAGELARFEQDAAWAGERLDAVVGQHQKDADEHGASNALVSTYMGLQLLSPGMLAALLAVAIQRLAVAIQRLAADDVPPG